MPRKLTARAARKMQAARKTKAGGRPRVPTNCPKCGAECDSARAALGHCCLNRRHFMEIKNGTIHWVPSPAFREKVTRAGGTLADVLTDGHAGSDELGQYIEFSCVNGARVSVSGKPDLKKLWEAATANERS
jgi:hypothetical protein